jgi:ribonuclease HI
VQVLQKWDAAVNRDRDSHGCGKINVSSLQGGKENECMGICKNFVCKKAAYGLCAADKGPVAGNICNRDESCGMAKNCENCKMAASCRMSVFNTEPVSNPSSVPGITPISGRQEHRGAYAYVDGSYNKNTRTYGYGVYFVDETGKADKFCGNGNDPGLAAMRNVAGEISGAMAAVERARLLKIRKLTIYYDYTGIEYWVTGRWKANKTGTIVYRDYMKTCGIKLQFVKVKGHSGNEGNEIADQLAKQAVGI